VFSAAGPEQPGDGPCPQEANGEGIIADEAAQAAKDHQQLYVAIKARPRSQPTFTLGVWGDRQQQQEQQQQQQQQQQPQEQEQQQEVM